MKTLYKSALVLILAAGWAGGAVNETVYLDLEQAFSKFYKTKLADTQLKAQVAEVQEESQDLIDVFEALQQKFEQLRTESLDKTLSEELRDNKRNEAEETLVELQQKENEIRNFEALSRKQLESQKQRMRARLLQEIREAINSEARLKGYRAVLNSTARGSTYPDVVIYHDEDADITADILAILNRGQQEEEPDAEASAEKDEANESE
jgi:outer membrane protein